MPNEEYEIAKKERARKAKLGMLSFFIMLVALVGGIVFIALTIP